MKIGIISDLHANIFALQAVLDKLKKTEMIICAGDITGYYPYPNEVIETLTKYKVKWIRGNLDDYLLDGKSNNKIIDESINFSRQTLTHKHLHLLERAPRHLSLKVDNRVIKVYHESPWGEERIYPDYSSWEKFQSVPGDIIILGHTHYPLIKTIDQKLIINPGSCGQPRDNNSQAAYAILETKTMKAEIYRVKYNKRLLIAKLKQLKIDHQVIDILGDQ